MTPERAHHILNNVINDKFKYAFPRTGDRVTYDDGITWEEHDHIMSVWHDMGEEASYHDAVCVISSARDQS